MQRLDGSHLKITSLTRRMTSCQISGLADLWKRCRRSSLPLLKVRRETVAGGVLRGAGRQQVVGGLFIIYVAIQ